MRLLGSAANTVMGLAGLGLGAYNTFKGANSSSKGLLVSEDNNNKFIGMGTGDRYSYYERLYQQLLKQTKEVGNILKSMRGRVTTGINGVSNKVNTNYIGPKKVYPMLNTPKYSEVKSELKKKYPFLDEASLRIISNRILEDNDAMIQNLNAANKIKVGGETNAMTGQVGSGDLGKISNDLSNKFNGQYSPEMIQKALSDPAENPTLAGLAQNSLANMYTQKNITGNTSR